MPELDNNDTPIILKKVSKGGHGHHGGAWKVAYADFVTAMMALFIVLWILGQDDSVKNNIAGYFNDPSGFGSGNGPSVIEGAGQKNIAPSILTEFQRKEREKERLESAGNELMEKLGDPEFKDLIDQIDMQITEEGLRVEIMESNKNAFFEVGTAELKKSAQKILSIFGKQLAKLENKIVIEGHTDSRPFPQSGRAYSNYELSTDRANAARRVLIENGLKPNQVDEVRGYADNRLRDIKNPFDVVNRRISIIVKYTDQ